MKILHFIYDHPNNPWCGGGGAKRTWTINSILARRHEITIICGGFPQAIEQDTPFKVRFLGKPKRYILSRLNFILGSSKVNQGNYDLIVEDFSAYAPIILRKRKVPLITILHLFHSFSAFQSNGMLGLLAFMSEKLILAKRKNLIFVSEHLREAAPLANNSVVIGQGVTLPQGLKSSEAKYVLFLGRMDIWHKGIDILLEAWSLIPEDKRKIPLYIVGGGKEWEKIQNIIKEKGLSDVKLLGRQDHETAMKFIAESAFLVMPSRTEGNPLVIGEAFSLGKPLIVSSIKALSRLIQHNRNGLIFPHENVKALAQAIQILMTNSKLQRQLGDNARQKGEQFNWDTIARKQEQFYLEILEKSLSA